MSHLLAIAVGPVQEFIAAARRTRDLWFGSYLLSEISREVAKAVSENGGKLVFPESLDAENVANIILAEIESVDPAGIAVKAKEAAKKRWRQFADDALFDAKADSSVIRQDVWNSQVDDVIEFYAAWVSATDHYAADRANVMRLLAGRKNCRDFSPAVGNDGGLPKSSLDGQRETVLYPQDKWRSRFRAQLRVRDGEQLDVVGFVKRLGDGKHPYPSVSRIAADPWLRGNANRLDEVNAACEQLYNVGMLHKIDRDKFPEFSDFPFEGTSVFASRLGELLEETVDPTARKLESEKLKPLQSALAAMQSEPNPYLAVLVADGDKIGAALSQLRTAQANRDFSRNLAGFAIEVKKIVCSHNGVLVYAGGDDVMAFLPVDKCLACTRELHKSFETLMQQYKHDGESPTLSAGIAIAHFMENLEDLLEYGRAAEKSAKRPDRNGLAVHLHKRGGAPIHVRGQWTDEIDKRLGRYAELLRAEAIPGKLPYEMRSLFTLYENWPAESISLALRQDVLRVIRDKQPRAGNRFLSEIEDVVKTRISDVESLRAFSNELLVAKQIASAMQQAKEPVTIPMQMEVAL